MKGEEECSRVETAGGAPRLVSHSAPRALARPAHAHSPPDTTRARRRTPTPSSPSMPPSCAHAAAWAAARGGGADAWAPVARCLRLEWAKVCVGGRVGSGPVSARLPAASARPPTSPPSPATQPDPDAPTTAPAATAVPAFACLACAAGADSAAALDAACGDPGGRRTEREDRGWGG